MGIFPSTLLWRNPNKRNYNSYQEFVGTEIKLHQSWVGHPFPFRNALIACGTDSTSGSKNSKNGVFAPRWHYGVIQLVQICRLHTHEVNLPLHHMPKCCIGLISGVYGGHLSTVKSLLWRYELCNIALYLPSEDGYSVVCGHNIQVGCGISTILIWHWA